MFTSTIQGKLRMLNISLIWLVFILIITKKNNNLININ